MLGACAATPPASAPTEPATSADMPAAEKQAEPFNAASTQPDTEPELAPQNLNLKHIVHFAATPAWASILQNSLRPMVTIGAVQHAQFKLNVQVQHSQAPTDKISLSGLLQRHKVQQITTINARLSNRAGDTLYEDTFTYEHAPITTMGSKTHPHAPLPPPAQEKFARQIAQALRPIIQAQPWSLPVISQLDAEHVMINAGPETGLFPGARLQTVQEPAADLTVAVFETNARGEQNAVLRLVKGALPAPGRALTPAP